MAMKPKIDFGVLTEEETKEIAIKALEQLNASEVVEVLKASMEDETLHEVVARLTE
jgi:hypothetical protein